VSARARAELIADRGAAGGDAQFFRSRAFLDAEEATHTLRVETETGDLLAPLLVRPIPPPAGLDAANEVGNPPVGPLYDGVSPYGYPGVIAPQGLVLDPSEIDFSATCLVSLFLRHRLGEPPLSGVSERNVVQIADPSLPSKSRPSDRRQIRKNLEAGYELKLVPGAETTPAQRRAFRDVYEQTMRRTAAADRYFFAAAYFDRLLAAERTWLALALAPDGVIAAASIAAVSDGFLHYYLSGSADSHLRDSPMKNVVAALAEHATELNLPLNLGGGITPGDPLEEFKRGFANREMTWHTSEIICNEEKYNQLSAGHPPGLFFPTYRG
jgi:hypothetical protein